MHIPDPMLQGAVCPVTAVVGLAGVTLAAIAAARTGKKPGAARFAAVSAFIFAAQMMNFPVIEGTSGHLLGGVLAVALLGAPFAVLALTLVLMMQAVVFNDGGLLALGANVMNLALIGGVLGALLQTVVRRHDISLLSRSLLFGLTGWIAVMVASLAVSAELAASDAVAFSRIAPAMLGVHAWIGIGEALITTAVCLVWVSDRESTIVADRKTMVILSAALGAALFLSPFASGLPDGLEFVSAALGLLSADGGVPLAPFSGYLFPGTIPVAVATGLAGFIGILLTFSVAWLLAQRLNLHGKICR